MKLIEYCHFTHARLVLDLWERAMGDTYPVSDRVFLSRTCGRTTYEPGDAVVAEENGQIIGFIMVELGRKCNTVPEQASIMTLFVDPAHQRQGIGSAILRVMEEKLRGLGVERVSFGGSQNRFWTSLPEDFEAGRSFLEHHGYIIQDDKPASDLVWPVEGYTMTPKSRQRLDEAGVTKASVRSEEALSFLEFEEREFRGWVPQYLQMLAAGDQENILVMRRDSEIIGAVAAYTPKSRWRSPNLVWERVHGASMGGLAAVGIAGAWRGKGLGAAICEAAALHVQAHGGTCCYIDWTGITPFYERLGARVWRTFHPASKTL